MTKLDPAFGGEVINGSANMALVGIIFAVTIGGIWGFFVITDLVKYLKRDRGFG